MDPNKDILTWLKTQAIIRGRRAVLGGHDYHMAIAERFHAAATEIEDLRHELQQARGMLETAARAMEQRPATGKDT